MIGDLIGEWIKGILIDGIMGNLSGLFNTVNTKVGEIASDVGSTPQDWNGGIFSMLQNLSETVIVPIAAAILALVMCYELIDMIVEKNNMHDFDSSMFFRWIFKSAFAILIVTNTWNIVMGVFDATQQVVNQSAGVIIGDTSIDFDTLLPDLESRLEAMDIGPLLGLWFQTLVVGLTMNILSICIFLVTYYYVAYTITDYDNATSGSGVTTTALSNRTGHAWNFNFSDSVSGKSLPMPPANYAKGATTTRPSNLADTYYNTYTANTGVTLNRSLYDVHHIRPLAYGGSNAYSNLIHLPKATHTQVTSWWAGY